MSQNVYQKIALVQAELCAEGISKDSRNEAQKYNFRGIDRFPDYLFTECGNVYTLKSNKFLKPILQRNGYCHVNLNGKVLTLHRVICEAFHGESGLHVNHKNGVKHDNRAENLEWVTISQNMKHSYDAGLRVISDLHKEKCAALGRAKSSTSPMQKSAIFGMFTGKRGDISAIANRLGLSRYAVSDVLFGRR